MPSITEIIGLGDAQKIITALTASDGREIDKWRKEYDGDHEILNLRDKIVGTGRSQRIVKVAKEIVTYQQDIVDFAVAFLFGAPVNLVLNSKENSHEDVYELITEVWRGRKLDEFNRKLARSLFVETKVAELWFVHPETKDIKVMLLSNKTGNEVFAHYDDYGDMDAFTRKYSTAGVAGKKVEYVDVYTATVIYNYTKTLSGWEQNEQSNPIGKIPVVYYDQEKPEWANVQTQIDRIETMLSKFSDMNDYFASPGLKVKGKIADTPAKEEVGKMFVFEGIRGSEGKIEYGDVEYLTWNNSPEALKTEFEIKKDIIYAQTKTPDLSFNNVKGISNLSGIALKFMFLASELKANNKQEIFGEGLTRRINVLKAILSKTDYAKIATQTNRPTEEVMHDLNIGITFNSVLPEDERELIELLSIARGGEPTMSNETAVKNNKYVTDPKAELESLEKEKQQQSASQIAASFNL